MCRDVVECLLGPNSVMKFDVVAVYYASCCSVGALHW